MFSSNVKTKFNSSIVQDVASGQYICRIVHMCQLLLRRNLHMAKPDKQEIPKRKALPCVSKLFSRCVDIEMEFPKTDVAVIVCNQLSLLRC